MQYRISLKPPNAEAGDNPSPIVRDCLFNVNSAAVIIREISCPVVFIGFNSTRNNLWFSAIFISCILNVTTNYTLRSCTRHSTTNNTSSSGTNFILDFKLSPCSKCCIISFGWFPGFWILYVDVSKHSVPS